jgi:hypothetical protein
MVATLAHARNFQRQCPTTPDLDNNLIGVRRHIGKHGGKSGFSRYAAQVDLDQGI